MEAIVGITSLYLVYIVIAVLCLFLYIRNVMFAAFNFLDMKYGQCCLRLVGVIIPIFGVIAGMFTPTRPS